MLVIENVAKSQKMNTKELHSQNPSGSTFDSKGIDIANNKVVNENKIDNITAYSKEDVEIATQLIKMLMTWRNTNNEKESGNTK